MAKNNVPQEGQTSGDKKQLPSARDNYDTLTRKLCQLEAMLVLSYGDARQAIDEMNDSLRDHYYWACADMAKDCGNLLAAIPYPDREVAHA